MLGTVLRPSVSAAAFGRSIQDFRSQDTDPKVQKYKIIKEESQSSSVKRCMNIVKRRREHTSNHAGTAKHVGRSDSQS